MFSRLCSWLVKGEARSASVRPRPPSASRFGFPPGPEGAAVPSSGLWSLTRNSCQSESCFLAAEVFSLEAFRRESVCAHVQLFAAPHCPSGSSMGFVSRQEYCSGLLFPSPGDLPDPGIQPSSLAPPALQAGSLPLGHLGSESF